MLLMAGIKAGKARGVERNSWRRCWLTRAGEMLEVEGDPDRWVPPVSGRAKKKKGMEAVGLWWAASERARERSEAGGWEKERGGGPLRVRWAACASGKKEKGRPAGLLGCGGWREKKRARKKKNGPLEKGDRWAEKGEGGERFGEFSFFKFFFQTFKLFSKFKHFKPFQNFQNNLKTFKTSHQQTKTLCNQKMTHKHLLLLNY
jgi:hypothetical protein